MTTAQRRSHNAVRFLNSRSVLRLKCAMLSAMIYVGRMAAWHLRVRHDFPLYALTFVVQVVAQSLELADQIVFLRPTIPATR